MRVMDRYLGRTVIVSTLLALLVLLSVDLFFGFINEVQDIGRGEYRFRDVLIYLGLTIPGRVYEMFPMAVLIGTLLGLGALAANSELIALRAAGVSVLRIIGSVMKAGVVLLIFSGLVGEWVAPAAEQMAQNHRSLAQAQRVTYQSPYGFWARDGDHFIRIRQIYSDGRLGDIEVFELGDEGQLIAANKADEAVYVDGRWQLSGVQGGAIESDRLVLTQQARLDWETLLDPELLNVVLVEPESLSARDLFKYVRYRSANELETARYELAFWQRVVAPFSSLVMLFLAVPFVFGHLRDVGTGQRLLIGVMVGLGYYLLSQTMSHLGQVYGLNPLLSAVTPPLLFLGWGIHQMRQIR